MDSKPLLILGIGNKILSDDGIGIKLVEDLQTHFRHPFVHFKTACAGGLEIVEIMQDYDRVIILDAIKTEGGKPGKIHHLTLQHFKDTLHTSNFHDISFLIALEFGKTSGMKIPGDIQILAIEIVEDMYFSENLSNEIQVKYKFIRSRIRDFIQKQIKNRKVQKSQKVTA
jgi:hydrogenase maturation protease